jgi:hypothetical protein
MEAAQVVDMLDADDKGRYPVCSKKGPRAKCYCLIFEAGIV